MSLILTLCSFSVILGWVRVRSNPQSLYPVGLEIGKKTSKYRALGQLGVDVVKSTTFRLCSVTENAFIKGKLDETSSCPY